MRLYKAFVTSVQKAAEGNHKEIYVQEKINRGTGARPKPATPPSSIPITQMGSGMLSVPDKGSECIVLEIGPTERHIIRYIPHKNTSQWGLLYPPNLENGTVLLSSNSYYQATIKLDRQGKITIKSGVFSEFWIDGPKSMLFSKVKNLDISYSGGFWRHKLNKEDKKTYNIQVWTKEQDKEGISDVKFRTEQGYKVPVPFITPPYTYVDKVIQKIGSIPEEQSLWSLETRESINPLNAYDKNAVTKLKLGYQKEGLRYDKDFPAGTLIDWTGKKNIKGDLGTFSFRWGKLKDNTPNSEDKGEIFRIQALEGLNNGIPLGTPITDPLGEGLGHNYSKGDDAEQTLSFSFGLLEDNTLFRQITAYKPAIGEEISRKLVLGGEKVFFEEIKHDKAFYSHVLTQEAQKISRKVAGGDLDLDFDEEKTKITFKGADGTSEIILKGNEVIISENDGAKLKLGGGMVGLGKGSVEVVQILHDVIDLLINTKSPGYGAPISTVPQFTPLLKDIKGILGGI